MTFTLWLLVLIPTALALAWTAVLFLGHLGRKPWRGDEWH